MNNLSKSGKANKKTRKSVSSRESTYESTTCNAVLLTESTIGDDKEIKGEAKDALGQALQEEDLYVEDVRGKHFVGRFLARRAAEVRAVKDELASLKDEIASLEDEISQYLKKHDDEISQYLKQHDDEITQLKDRVYNLEVSSKKYMQLRNRYISTFKRDKLCTSTSTDHAIIRNGSQVTHVPNAITDAALYTSLNQRSDTVTFEKLYGLDPAQVSRMKHAPTIAALNTHASIISSQRKFGSEKFYKAFAEFIKLLKESNCDESYLDHGKANSLARAYEVFLQCATDEVE